MKRLDVEILYGKHPALKREYVQQINDWISRQPHLPKITDLEIACFLRASNYSVEGAKSRIDNFYTCRSRISVFSDRDILGDDVTFTKDVICHLMLPQRTPQGHKIILTKFIDNDASKFNFEKLLKITTFVNEIELLEEGPGEGVILIADLQGAKLSHLARVNLNLLKQLLFYMTDCYPCEVAQFHYINTVPFMDKIMALTKQFLRNDFLNKVHVHGKVSDLGKFFPLKLMPRDYEGGEEEETQVLWEKYWSHLCTYRDHFLQEEKSRRVDEKLRPKKSAVLEDIFGVEGSFRKLDLD